MYYADVERGRYYIYIHVHTYMWAWNYILASLLFFFLCPLLTCPDLAWNGMAYQAGIKQLDRRIQGPHHHMGGLERL